ncbi:MAG: flagellar assembly protein FliW [Geminicoccaceae bacterium]|nr:MAG: flagellar assembly protein FliW [Geminicoccaceae bacterium]
MTPHEATRSAASTLPTPFGPIETDRTATLTFPLGLPGFPAVDRFVLTPIPGSEGPFHLLHGLGEEAVDLVVTPLETVAPSIDPADVATVRDALQIDAASLLVLLVVTLPAKGSGQSPMVNLRAPIFVDVDRHIAVQTVLPDSRYPFRKSLVAA